MIRVLILSLLLSLSAFSQTSTYFQEYFDSSLPTQQWTIKSSLPNTLRWWDPSDKATVYGTTPGFFGRNDLGSGLAYAPWAAGNSPFHFQFDVYPVSIWQKAQPGGVIVALSTAVPGSMGKADSAIVVALWPSGPMVDMRSGELNSMFTGNSFASLSLSREWRWMVGQPGGTGGAHNESFPWPQASNGGPIPYWRWTFEVIRDSVNNLTWNVYTDQYQNGTVPYYTYTMAIPSGHLLDSLQYVSLVTIGPAGLTPYQAAVKVTNMRGRSGQSAAVPTISSVTPANGSTTYQSGNTILISGSNFSGDSPYTLRVGQAGTLKTATASFVSPTTLSAILPGEPDGNYPMHIQRGGIDAEYYPGLTYSKPVVSRIDPFEVPLNPATTADGTVQIYGAGFDPTSTVTIAGNPALVTYVNPLQLSVVVPSGVAGPPSLLVTCASGTVVAYDSSNPATYPASGKLSFGYAPHPYLQFNSITLATLQARWTDPNFASYVYPIVQGVTPGAGQGSGTGGAPDFWDMGYQIALSGDMTLYPTYKALLSSDSLGQNLAGLSGLPTGELNRLQFTVPYASWQMYLYNYASQIAQFYDQFFPILTPAERAQYQTYLRNALGSYYYVEHANDDQVTGSAGWPNRVAVANAGAGIVALSLVNSIQSVRGYAIGAPWVATTGRTEAANAVTRIKKWLTVAWTADGGYAEGPLYAGYGMTAALTFTHALENTNAMLGVSPADGGMFSGGSYFANFQNWVNSIWDGTQWSTFDDAQPQAYMLGMLVDADNRFGLPNLTYLADYLKSQIMNGTGIYQNRAVGAWSGGGDYPAFAFMWRNSVFPAAFSGFPTLQVNDSVQQAALRSDSTIATPFYIGIKGTSNHEVATNLHHENDTGSFVVQSRGELFLIDPGYYLPDAPNHSVLSIDGKFPGLANSNVAVMDTSASLNNIAFRSATLDASKAYAGVSSFRRVFTMYTNGSSQLGIVLDDVQTAGAGSIVSYYQSGQSTSLNGSSGFTMTGNSSQLIATFDGPSTAIAAAAGKPSFHAGTSASSWVYDALSCQAPKDPWCQTTTAPYLQKYTTIQAAWTAGAGTPLLTMLTPAGLDGSGALTAKVDRSTPGVINVSISDGASLQFSQQAGIWKLSATSAAPAP